MIDRVRINGTMYAVTPVPEGEQPSGSTVTVDGVTYLIGTSITAPAEMAQQAIEKIQVNGVLYDIADVEAVEAETRRATSAEKDIKTEALQTNTFTVDAHYADLVNLYMRTLNGETRIEPIPAATIEHAGVMSAEDKKKLNEIEVVQSTGDSATAVMSQKAVSKAFKNIFSGTVLQLEYSGQYKYSNKLEMPIPKGTKISIKSDTITGLNAYTELEGEFTLLRDGDVTDREVNYFRNLDKTGKVEVSYGSLIEKTLDGYLFAGIANADLVHNTKEKVYYIADKDGKYNNLGGITVYEGEIAYLLFDGKEWRKESIIKRPVGHSSSSRLCLTDFNEVGYLTPNEGKLAYIETWKSTGYIPFSRNSEIRVLADCKNQYVDYISFYDKDKKYISGKTGNSSNTDEVVIEPSEIPMNAVYFRLCQKVNDFAYAIYTLDIIENINKVIKTEIDSIATDYNKSLITRAEGDLAENEQLVLEVPDSKNYHAFSFEVNFSTFGRLRFSHGESAYAAGAIEIDSTNVYVYKNSNPSEILNTIPHGLNLNTFVRCSIIVGCEVNTAKLVITTLSGKFNSDITWNGSKGEIILKSISGNYTSSSLRFGGSCFDRKVWVFGDSYTDYWPIHVYSEGCRNFYLDGYSGRNSLNALKSLKIALNYGRPSIVVWMMGMNDVDKESEVNSNYKNAFDDAKELCKSLNVTFIPCTIADTPIRTNNWKSNYVRANSSIYIDMAKKLGADYIGASWYEGLISADNVHPSTIGAQVIASVLIQELPQISGE